MRAVAASDEAKGQAGDGQGRGSAHIGVVVAGAGLVQRNRRVTTDQPGDGVGGIETRWCMGRAVVHLAQARVAECSPQRGRLDSDAVDPGSIGRQIGQLVIAGQAARCVHGIAQGDGRDVLASGGNMLTAGGGAAVAQGLAAHAGLYAHKACQASAAVVGLAGRQRHGLRSDIGQQACGLRQTVVATVGAREGAAVDGYGLACADILVVKRCTAQVQADRIARNHPKQRAACQGRCGAAVVDLAIGTYARNRERFGGDIG